MIVLNIGLKIRPSFC